MGDQKHGDDHLSSGQCPIIGFWQMNLSMCACDASSFSLEKSSPSRCSQVVAEIICTHRLLLLPSHVQSLIGCEHGLC